MINLRKQKHQMKRFKLQSLWFIAFTLLGNACAHVDQPEKIAPQGASITGCTLDITQGGFQCAAIDKEPWFVAFKDAPTLYCYAPEDLEAFLTSCKKGLVLFTPTCKVIKGEATCSKLLVNEIAVAINTLDNYFCMNEKDQRRVRERCTSNAF